MKDLLVSVEEYLSTSFDPDCEYVDGILVGRNVGERDHSYWQIELGAFLSARKSLGIYAFTGWRMQVRPTRFRIPDLTVVAGEWPKDRVLKQPPFLVIEIWSPDDKPTEMQGKIRDYRELGIPYILVIYPDEPRFVLYTKDSERELEDGVLRTKNPAIEIPLLEIYNQFPR
jgi:Uma2 family endonuclease